MIRYDGKTYDAEMPSVDLLRRFSVEIPDDATDEQRRCYLNFAIETFKLIERTGWYEHTCDWDLIVIVEYSDGAVFSSGCGAELHWEREDGREVSDNDTRRAFVEDEETVTELDIARIKTIRFEA